LAVYSIPIWANTYYIIYAPVIKKHTKNLLTRKQNRSVKRLNSAEKRIEKKGKKSFIDAFIGAAAPAAKSAASPTAIEK